MPESSMPGQWLDVSIDRGRCCGYAVCVGLCPEVFDLDDDGLARIVLDTVPVELESAVRARRRRHARSGHPRDRRPVSATHH